MEVQKTRTLWDHLLGREGTFVDGDYISVIVEDGKVTEVLCDDCVAEKQGRGRAMATIQAYEDIQCIRILDTAARHADQNRSGTK